MCLTLKQFAYRHLLFNGTLGWRSNFKQNLPLKSRVSKFAWGPLLWCQTPELLWSPIQALQYSEPHIWKARFGLRWKFRETALNQQRSRRRRDDGDKQEEDPTAKGIMRWQDMARYGKIIRFMHDLCVSLRSKRGAGHIWPLATAESCWQRPTPRVSPTQRFQRPKIHLAFSYFSLCDIFRHISTDIFRPALPSLEVSRCAASLDHARLWLHSAWQGCHVPVPQLTQSVGEGDAEYAERCMKQSWNIMNHLGLNIIEQLWISLRPYEYEIIQGKSGKSEDDGVAIILASPRSEQSTGMSSTGTGSEVELYTAL